MGAPAPPPSPEEGMPPESLENLTDTMVSVANEDPEADIPPELKAELDAYRTIINKFLHSDQMRDKTLALLESKDIDIAVPLGAIQIDQLAFRATQGKVSSTARLAGSVHIVGDLIELGIAAQYWPEPSEEEIGVIYQDTLQDFIETGLADGTIDPIELQQSVEPLMSDEQRKVGSAYAEKTGVPMEVNPHVAMGNSQKMESNKEALAAQQAQPKPKPQQQPQQAQGQAGMLSAMGGK